MYLTLVALLSLGLTATVRDFAAAIGLGLGVPYLFPVGAAVISAQATTGLNRLPLWAGLGVVALRTTGALLFGALVLKSRDA